MTYSREMTPREAMLLQWEAARLNESLLPGQPTWTPKNIIDALIDADIRRIYGDARRTKRADVTRAIHRLSDEQVIQVRQFIAGLVTT
jgi:hypothetical protein